MNQHNTTSEPAALFAPFEWVGPSDQIDTGRYTMLQNIRDLASGVGVALQLVERANLDQDLGDAPIIDGSTASRLTRMSIAVMNVIEGYIDEHFDEMSDRGMARRQAEKNGEQT